LSTSTHPSVVLLVGVVVVVGLVPRTPKVYPRSEIGPRHQLYAALSGLNSKGVRRETR
jgi:hypothetical protein